MFAQHGDHTYYQGTVYFKMVKLELQFPIHQEQNLEVTTLS